MKAEKEGGERVKKRRRRIPWRPVESVEPNESARRGEGERESDKRGRQEDEVDEEEVEKGGRTGSAQRWHLAVGH